MTWCFVVIRDARNVRRRTQKSVTPNIASIPFAHWSIRHALIKTWTHLVCTYTYQLCASLIIIIIQNNGFAPVTLSLITATLVSPGGVWPIFLAVCSLATLIIFNICLHTAVELYLNANVCLTCNHVHSGAIHLHYWLSWQKGYFCYVKSHSTDSAVPDSIWKMNESVDSL